MTVVLSRLKEPVEMTRERYDYVRELVYKDDGIANDPHKTVTLFEFASDTAAWVCFGIAGYATYYSIPIPVVTPFFTFDGRWALGAAGYCLRRIGRVSMDRRIERMEDNEPFQQKVAKKYKERLEECQNRGLLPRIDPIRVAARKVAVANKKY